ncbi:biotin--[acetyl-CoA-carboxylase] ligase [Nostocoides sp. HKS02]|uniref:biotin--[acetyl-CoA-carboxylase] ligase n=1 Tax=Nostocoides sp. HKS02 TaxID=1813880 RepID=UPI0012B454B8|nr:biotin--[acetyl-CoA-carboxylase] ligase [Tetrasphaera sp. HKS02]QGN56638.1 biotin--[acetyl-CoA-carboxylase] ligase [Tetrasphaera sp. HKS02]
MREPLDREALHEALVTSGSPWTGIDVHPRLGSTNVEAARLAQPWRVVVTDHQEAGRGRLGRSWETPANTSVTLSVLLPAPDEARGWMPLVTGLAVLRGIAEVTGLRAGLKWPNDVLLAADDDRKVCGVLCELQPQGVVVGLGVNVDQTRDELPVDTATSLRLAGAQDVRREDLVVAILRHLAVLHGDLVRGGTARAGAQAAYREACLTTGREVDLHAADGTVRRVHAVGIDAQGRLVVASGGAEYAVAAGDVVHARRAPQG